MGALTTVWRSRAAASGLGTMADDVARYWTLVRDTAARYAVDPALVLAVIAQESQFHAGAINPRDPSYGLMQVQPATGGVSAQALLDPATNVDRGTAYLAAQLDRYGGDVPAALAAYNAGTARPVAGGGYRNQDYVTAVSGWYDYFRQNPPAAADAPLVVDPAPVESTDAPLVDGAAPVAADDGWPWWWPLAAVGLMLLWLGGDR